MNVVKAGTKAGPDVLIAEHMDWRNILPTQKAEIFHADAKVIFEWLREAIPGGTFDQLCDQMEMYQICKRRGLYNDGDEKPASGFIG